MVLAASHINKFFADQCIIKDATFHIKEGERLALVGSNGAGKTTLLRILIGELASDAGGVTIGKEVSIGYLPQQQAYNSEKTIYKELLMGKEDILSLDNEISILEQEMKHLEGAELESALIKYSKRREEFEKKDGYSYKSQVMGIINGLGFAGDDVDKPINQLSGGQKTRVALGKLLLSKPELLILDEPTNHLDLDAIRWLEKYLLNYKGSILIVSHDRYFLDRIADKVVEMEAGNVTVFSGNYSEYSKKKEALRKEQWNHYINQQKGIKHQEQVIEKLRSFNREKSIKRAESRVKLLDKMERLDKPVSEGKPMNLSLKPGKISGSDVLTVEAVSKHFGSLTLFKEVDFEMKRGEKAAILGENGTGKTTLLKIIAGKLKPDTGIIRLGANVVVGYYDQEHQVLSEEKTIFEEIQDDYPNLDHTKIRNVLAAFLFTGEDVHKTIKLLSGGEKGRVSLAKLMLSEANYLLLDEPTNHLDIESKEILENALQNYEGTVLYVSHDRYFIDRTATRIFDLTKRKLLSYSGDYNYYLEKKETIEGLYLESGSALADSRIDDTESKKDWKQKKAEEAERRRVKNECAKCEEKIEELESKISELDEKLLLEENVCNAELLLEITKEREEKKEKLTELMEKWEGLEELLLEMQTLIK